MLTKRPILSVLIFSAIFLIVGFILGKFFGVRGTMRNNTQTYRGEIRESGYKFISPLLDYDSQINYSQLAPFKNKINQLLDSLRQQHQIDTASVYFRDLDIGYSFDINGNDTFSPASLLKVPVMIAYYKEAEKNPGILQEKLVYKPTTQGLNDGSVNDTVLKAGQTYTVEDLIENMIIYSDNEAKTTLTAYRPDILVQPYQDLGVNIPIINGLDDKMSVNDYALFFRILFNSSYLTQDYSEKALEVLSRSKFYSALRAGVPTEIGMAHKWGLRKTDQGVQLHDCGIIYIPKHPYLLCVMTRGSDDGKLADAIKQVSALAYQEVNDNPSPGNN